MTEKKNVKQSKNLYSDTIDGGHIRVICRVNNNTDSIKIYTDFNTYKVNSTKALFSFVTDGVELRIKCNVNTKTDNIGINTTFQKSSDFGGENNKSCGVYLGVHVAERVLSYIYPNVIKMSNCNPGYDFICGKGYKVDVKSSCLRTQWKSSWTFNICKNKIADYFLCLAFDDREHLNPQHIWLIPGNIINNRKGFSISFSSLDKWSQYEQPLDKVITCCDSIR